MRLAYQTRYGYRFLDALRAEFWWRVEHLPFYVPGAYGRRKDAERRGYERRS